MPSCRWIASRRCSRLARKLEPLGHGNPEPIFVARSARLLAAPRLMKDVHIRFELARSTASKTPVGPSGAIRAVGWRLADRAAELKLREGSLVDLAYRIRENDHAQYGGLEVEIAGMQLPC